MNASSPAMPPVAIIGAACRLPGAPDLASLWALLASGTDAVSTVPAERFRHERFLHPRRNEPGTTYTLAAGTVGDIAGFDAGAFGISPREAMEMDPQQRLLLEVAAEAIDDSGIRPSALAGRDVAVHVGASATDYGVVQSQDVAVGDRYLMTGNALSILANRLTNQFDLRGRGQTVDTACSSSLVALDGALASLASGEAEMALAAGVHLLISPYAFVGFSRAAMLSPSGRCRAFDAAADGYVRAEGAVVLLLKPLDRAIADGDAIRGVILGSGVNAAGRTVGLSLPSRDAQARLIQRVLGQAGVEAARIAYFEAHGTGTAVGDPLEAWAIGSVAGRAAGRAAPLPIGSIKTNIGHTEPVSGLAGLLKAMLVLEKGQVPGSLHQVRPNPAIDFTALNLRVPTAMESLGGAPGQRIAAVNSFGFGGTNATALLAPAPLRPPLVAHDTAGPLPPLLLSARSAAALASLAERWQARLAEPDPLPALLRGAARHRDLAPHRLAARADDRAALAATLAAWRAGERPPGLTTGEVREVGSVCFVFSGNGAQWAGMAQATLQASASFATAMAAVDAALAPDLGWSVRARLEAGVTAAELAATDIAQPLLFAIQAALLPTLAEQGLVPDLVLGHSVGEVAAALAAGWLDLPAAARLVVARSRAQHRLRGQGRMAALSASVEAATALIADEPDLEIAAINAPAAVTLAGSPEALARIEAKAEAARMAFVPLDLDYAFHSRAMDPVCGELLHSLAGLAVSAPRLPMISTVTGAELAGPPDAAYWWRNLRQPVLFEQAVTAALRAGARHVVEIGPNPILQGYLRETARAAGIEATPLVSLSRRDGPGDPFPAIADRAFAQGLDPRQGPAFIGPAERRLPATPFDRKPAWYPQSTESALLADPILEHPLLGFRRGPEPGLWHHHLDTDRLPWLADHRLGADAVLPAAAMLDMALAAGRATHPDATALEVAEFRILHPLALEPGRSRAIRATLDSEGGFRLESRRRLTDDPWTLHAEGRVAPVPVSALDGPNEALLPARRWDGATLRAAAAARGMTYGPAFASVAAVEADPAAGAARLHLTLPETAPQDAGFLLHPARLDGAFQGLFALLPDTGATEEGMVPVRIARLLVAVGGAPAATAELRVVRRGKRSLRARFLLRDAAGRLAARAEGVGFQRVPLPGIAGAEAFRLDLDPVSEGASPAPDLMAARSAAAAAVSPDLSEVGLLLEAHVAAVAQREWSSTVGLPATATAQPYQAFLRRALVEDGAAEQGPGGIRLAPEGALPEPTAIWRSVLEEAPNLALDLAWIAEAAERVPDALRAGVVAPPPPAQGAAFARLAAPLAEAVAAVAEAWPEHQPLRILEVGAQPALTEAVLARLAPIGRTIIYSAAGPTAGPGRTVQGLTAREIAWTPGGAGPLPPPADLVIGLAAGARLRQGRTLAATLRPLLAEGGALLLAEPAPGRVWTFVCGQDPSWWTSLGTAPEGGAEWGALADATLWAGRLAQAGFADVEATPLPGTPWPALLVSAAVPAPSYQAAAPGPILLLADAGSQALAKALSGRLSRSGAPLVIQPLDQTPAPRTMKGKLVLALAAPDAASLPATATALTRLAEAAAGSAAGFALVTQGGAQPPAGPHVPEAGALVGLMRVLSNEMPALRPRRIDLCPNLPLNTAARRLEAELTRDPPEVTLAAEGRFAPRLRAGLALPPPDGPLTLAVTQPGRLSSLRWVALPERAPGPGEVALRVTAAGLNFRDLMWAQGLLPEEVLEAGFAGPTLGMECAGVVEAVGPGVALRPGTRVFGFVPGALATRAITRVEALAALPDGISPEAAATLPVAFMTALHALEGCAALQPGERVLIHGGAGAVGLAALQVALAAGAEVAMSAGTAAKRAFLRAAGADLVVDSRDPAFADALRAAWPDGVDVVLNSLAGDAMERSLGLLRPFGRFIELGKRDFVENRRASLRPLRRNATYFAVDVDELPAARPAIAARLLARLRDGLREGLWRPLPARIFAPEAVEEAFRTLQASTHIGKLVVHPPEPRAATTPAWQANPNGTYVVVGGTRGFGEMAARWLASAGARHLALIGRRAPSDGAALAELAKLGAQAAVYACDAADPAALSATLALIRAARPIRGVVHAAGILDDGAAVAMDAARFRRVLAPKLTAALNLDRLTEGDPLDLFLMFGSATTVFGNPGQANYVAANAGLETLARRRRAAGRPALTVAWGPIADVGMLADDPGKAAKLHRRLGVSAMPAAAALAALPAALAQPNPAPLILRLSGAEERVALPLLAEPMLAELAAAAPPPDQAMLRQRIALLPRAEAEAAILRLVAEEIARVLRLAPDAIGPDQPVVGLGLDSLGAMEMRGALEHRLGVQVPLAALTEELTVASFARQIAEVALASTGEFDDAAMASLVAVFEPESPIQAAE